MAKLVSTQIEQLREIGGYLRQLRLEQGRDLDHIANQIFIRAVLLQAIEEGQADLLPEPVFVQGFIRRYAEALGIDGKALSQEFTVAPIELLSDPEEIEAGTENSIKESPSAPPPVASASLTPAPAGPSFTPIDISDAGPAENTRNLFSLTLAASLGLLVLVVGLIIWGLQGRRSPTVTADNAPVEPGGPSQEAASVDPTTNSAPASEAPLPAVDEPPSIELDAPVVAKVTVSDRSWMRVVADGGVVFEGILETGSEETWIAQGSLTIRVGNSAGVSLTFNGNEPITLGDDSDPRTVTLTPETDVATLAVEI